MMLNEEECSNCLYYTENVCRYSPPQMFFVGFNEDKKPLIVTSYPTPPKGKKDWCGCHIPNGFVELH